jgi:transposase
MVLERTSVGLDVHARSILAGVLDSVTGELWSRRLPAATEAVLGWVGSLPGPVGVAYEAGPTGFGLARALQAAGVRCVVVAPSKLERPPGDRVKTDRRDAERLARLLHIGELPGVRVPTSAEEAARDLVRAREDARTDLMRARHRLSKLLLRQGLVFEGAAWTQAHGRWLARVGAELTQPGLRVTVDEAHGAVLAVQARRGRLDAAIAELAATPPWAAVVARLACLRGVGVLTGFGWPWRSATGIASPGPRSGPGWAWCPASSPVAADAARARSPRPATAMPDGCWSRRPGITASPTGPAGTSAPDRTDSPRWSENAPRWVTAGCISAGAGWMLVANAPPSAWSQSPVSLPDGAGAWPSWTPNQATGTGRWTAPTSARATRDTPMSSQADPTAW